MSENSGVTEIQAQACVYTTDRSSNLRQKPNSMHAMVINEAMHSSGKTGCGTYAKPESIYTNTGGGLLMQQLRDLWEGQERLRLGIQQLKESRQLEKESQQLEKESQQFEKESQQLREDIKNQTAFSRHLRRRAASARCRFFTRSKLRSEGKKHTILDRAATLQEKRADLVTDRVLFELGELSDHEEFQRLYGVSATEALSIECRFPSCRLLQ